MALCSRSVRIAWWHQRRRLAGARIGGREGNSNESLWGLGVRVDGRLLQWVCGDDTAARSHGLLLVSRTSAALHSWYIVCVMLLLVFVICCLCVVLASCIWLFRVLLGYVLDSAGKLAVVKAFNKCTRACFSTAFTVSMCSPSAAHCENPH